MNGQTAALMRSFGYEEYAGAGSFQCNGAANPAAGTIFQQRGLPFTVVYSATGVYTITFPPNLKLPKRAFFVDARIQGALADYGDFTVIENSLHTAACRLVIQLQRAGVATAPPALANNAFVQFFFLGTNNTGA